MKHTKKPTRIRSKYRPKNSDDHHAAHKNAPNQRSWLDATYDLRNRMSVINRWCTIPYYHGLIKPLETLTWEPEPGIWRANPYSFSLQNTRHEANAAQESVAPGEFGLICDALPGLPIRHVRRFLSDIAPNSYTFTKKYAPLGLHTRRLRTIRRDLTCLNHSLHAICDLALYGHSAQINAHPRRNRILNSVPPMVAWDRDNADFFDINTDPHFK